MIEFNALPNDVERLKHLVIEREATLEAMDVSLRDKQLQIDQMTQQLAQLPRARFGQPSGSLAGVDPFAPPVSELDAAVASAFRETHNLKGITNFVEAGCNCPQCSGR